MLHLGFAIGTAPDKWVRRFRQYTAHGGMTATGVDDPMPGLLRGDFDVALARLPHPLIDDSMHLITAYRESPGIAVPKGSVYAEVGEPVTAADIAGEIVNYRVDDSGALDLDELRTALQVVAANVGIAIAPRPVLRDLSRKQVVHLDYIDESVPHTQIGVVFLKERDSEVIQDFVGITKGRRATSSRHSAPKRTAREKAKAKQARRQKH